MRGVPYILRGPPCNQAEAAHTAYPARLVSSAALLLAAILAADDEDPRDGLLAHLHRTELSVTVGLQLNVHLVEHQVFAASLAHNFTDSLAVEARIGYARSGHTAFAAKTAAAFFVQSLTAIPMVTDLGDLWELKGHGMLAVRWGPIVGDVSVFDELFFIAQPYLWLGVGAGQFERTSIAVCNAAGTLPNGKRGCLAFLKNDKAAVIVSGAIGVRHFLHRRHVIRLELRDTVWADEYLANVDRRAALDPATPQGFGTPVTSLTHLVQLDVGYTFFF